MSVHTRRKQILEYLSSHERVLVSEAVKIFDASPATIRRDFAEISAAGGVTRIRGGICRNLNRFDKLVPLALRGRWYSAEKRFLAAQAYRYIKNARVIFVDGGSTTTHLGMFLRDPEQVVITNSLPLCNMFSEIFPAGGGPEIRMTGGVFHPESGLLLGANAEATVTDYHADIAVISARGVNSGGVYNHNELIAGINRRMIENADRTILIADHTKIGAVAMTRVCSLQKIDAVFTVATPQNQTELGKIREIGCEVFSDCPFENFAG